MALAWNVRIWPRPGERDGAIRTRMPPNNGYQIDAPRAARA
jgi:hypothetical protein